MNQVLKISRNPNLLFHIRIIYFVSVSVCIYRSGGADGADILNSSQSQSVKFKLADENRIF